MISKLKSLVPQVVKNYLWHLPKAILANIWYGFPARKLIVVGVTGTKGKTTTVHLIHHLLSQSGHKTLLVSSLGTQIGKKLQDTGLHVTNPEPFLLQKLLRSAVTQKCTHAVLEVTSHGLDQHRVWGIPFKLAVFTHIVAEHLDYHRRFSSYMQAKAKLLRVAETAVVNRLDPARPFLKKQATSHRILIREYGKKGDNFPEQNQQAAVAASVALGITEKKARLALKSFPGVVGRMQTVYKKSFRVVVDFAHTPESLESALKLLRSQMGGKGKLIAVFGCAGERDPGRRRMGQVSAKLANMTIITAEDPRTEDVNQISTEIARWAQKAGAKENQDYVIINDRQKAIDLAIASLAHRGDVVGVFGKGHEQSMSFGKIEYPWSDHEAIKKALKKRS